MPQGHLELYRVVSNRCIENAHSSQVKDSMKAAHWSHVLQAMRYDEWSEMARNTTADGYQVSLSSRPAFITSCLADCCTPMTLSAQPFQLALKQQPQHCKFHIWVLFLPLLWAMYGPLEATVVVCNQTQAFTAVNQMFRLANAFIDAENPSVMHLPLLINKACEE